MATRPTSFPARPTTASNSRSDTCTWSPSSMARAAKRRARRSAPSVTHAYAPSPSQVGPAGARSGSAGVDSTSGSEAQWPFTPSWRPRHHAVTS